MPLFGECKSITSGGRYITLHHVITGYTPSEPGEGAPPVVAELEGESVTLGGLKGRPELNGERVVVGQLDGASGRYEVRLPSGEWIKVRRINLVDAEVE